MLFKQMLESAIPNRLIPFPSTLKRVTLNVFSSWESKELRVEIFDVLAQILTYAIGPVFVSFWEQTDDIEAKSAFRNFRCVERDSKCVIRVWCCYSIDKRGTDLRVVKTGKVLDGKPPGDPDVLGEV